MIVNEFLTFIWIHQDIEQAIRGLRRASDIQAFAAIRCGRTIIIVDISDVVVCRGTIVIVDVAVGRANIIAIAADRYWTGNIVNDKRWTSDAIMRWFNSARIAFNCMRRRRR